MNNRILIIGLVWPEPTSSAAGWRMLQLIDELKKIATDIHFACAAAKSVASHPLANEQVVEHSIVLNDSMFNDFVRELQPTIVVYDRFLIEEQFGWRVKQELPHALTVLDTEDLHFVRRARTVAYKNNTEIDYDTADCHRELAAIHRCDVSLIISPFEYDLLVHQFQIPKVQLLYLPFIETHLSEAYFRSLPTFDQRKNIVFIGNFIHEPNYETVLQLKKMWPLIRKRLKNVELHIYGAYPSQKINQLQNTSEGFIIKGTAENVNTTMQNYRVLAAPIPFGAGLKGKFIDGFKNNLPNVTTSIGSEGIATANWAGFVVDQPEDFVNAVCELYNNERIWNESVLNGYQIINQYFSDKIWNGVLATTLLSIQKQISIHRKKLPIQKMLWHHSLQSIKYMSLWIETKNKLHNNR
ncbi:glycosyltransferase [Flavobacterium sp. CBA20B-1]|uniref:glycosyltransferase n=1 Tax=unclassified Flavobacterium TaxID=196869 RepID=UPI0022259463|nr:MULTISPECIES: glycosyltransferase [unclassified Flavobacterium]WCM40867.1 glycosyltransferase [Flavobacterium sp. CBA20B-1]